MSDGSVADHPPARAARPLPRPALARAALSPGARPSPSPARRGHGPAGRAVRPAFPRRPPRGGSSRHRTTSRPATRGGRSCSSRSSSMRRTRSGASAASARRPAAAPSHARKLSWHVTTCCGAFATTSSGPRPRRVVHANQRRARTEPFHERPARVPSGVRAGAVTPRRASSVSVLLPTPGNRSHRERRDQRRARPKPGRHVRLVVGLVHAGDEFRSVLFAATPALHCTPVSASTGARFGGDRRAAMATRRSSFFLAQSSSSSSSSSFVSPYRRCALSAPRCARRSIGLCRFEDARERRRRAGGRRGVRHAGASSPSSARKARSPAFCPPRA